MNRNATHRSVRELGPGPHTWEQAAEYLAMAQLEMAFRLCLRNSGVPGADSIADDGSWPLADRVRFLKFLCGEAR
jgi:hypothetical protein